MYLDTYLMMECVESNELFDYIVQKGKLEEDIEVQVTESAFV